MADTRPAREQHLGTALWTGLKSLAGTTGAARHEPSSAWDISPTSLQTCERSTNNLLTSPDAERARRGVLDPFRRRPAPPTG